MALSATQQRRRLAVAELVMKIRPVVPVSQLHHSPLTQPHLVVHVPHDSNNHHFVDTATAVASHRCSSLVSFVLDPRLFIFLNHAVDIEVFSDCDCFFYPAVFNNMWLR